jgi:hypothetical protein
MSKLEHVLGISFGFVISLLIMHLLGGIFDQPLWFYLKCITIGFSSNALIHPWVDLFIYELGPYSCCERCYNNWKNHPWYNNWENNGYNCKFILFFHLAFFISLYSNELYMYLLHCVQYWN